MTTCTRPPKTFAVHLHPALSDRLAVALARSTMHGIIETSAKRVLAKQPQIHRAEALAVAIGTNADTRACSVRPDVLAPFANKDPQTGKVYMYTLPDVAHVFQRASQVLSYLLNLWLMDATSVDDLPPRAPRPKPPGRTAGAQSVQARLAAAEQQIDELKQGLRALQHTIIGV